MVGTGIYTDRSIESAGSFDFQERRQRKFSQIQTDLFVKHNLQSASSNHTRLTKTFDKHLQKTQYGFRKKRGTADAIHYVRRMVDKGAKSNTETLLVLLDWENVFFDKVLHRKLYETLERLNVPA